MKKTIFTLLALVMTTVTASAFELAKGKSSEDHGRINFKVGSQPVTSADAGQTVTVEIIPATGYVVNRLSGVWYAAQARVQRRNQANTDINIDMKTVFEPEKLPGAENTWSFVMDRANAEINVSYKRLIQTSWIGNIDAVTYNGQEQKPTPTVRVNGSGTRLTQGIDYTLEYSENISAGTATVKVIANPESDLYAGSASKTFTIRKAALTVRADNKSIVFGDPAPAYTATYTGFVNGETKDVLSGTLSFSCPYVRNVSDAGSYEIIPGGQTSVNYAITYEKGTLTVGKKAFENSVISFVGSPVYNGQPQEPAPILTYNGITLRENTDYTLVFSNNVNAGSATVTAIGSGNFSGTASSTFTIQKKQITVSGITAQNKIYDGSDAAELIYENAVFDGIIEGDHLTVEATGRFSTKDVGSNKIVYIHNYILDGEDIANYRLSNYTSQPSTWGAISKKTLTVTARAKSVRFGDAPANDGVYYDGFVGDEDETELDGDLEYSYNTEADGSGTPYVAGSPVGTYYIIPRGLSAQNYAIVYNAGTLSVCAPAVTLDEQEDNTVQLEDANGLVLDVTLTRTLQTGGWNSFAVPFDISSEELSAKGITAKELTGSSLLDGALTLNFTEAASIKAGKPYLVKVTETLENPTFERVLVKKDAVTTETAAVNFVPTLGKTLVTGPAGDEDNAKAVFILGAGNKLSNPSSVNDPNSLSSYMKGFRAYFQLADNTKNVRSISLDIDEDAETAINEVHETSGAGEDLVLYDLQGRRVSNTKQKGLYIVNGKKVIK